MHDCWAYTGHCSYYTYAKCNKWETHCNHCPQLNKYPKSLGYDNSFSNFDLKKDAFNGIKNLTIVTPSKWLKNEIERSFLQDYPITVINNGIDLEVFKPTQSNFRKQYNLEDKKIILGVASVWDERKGLDYFIEISKLLEENEIIVLVGLELKGYPNIISIKRTNDAKELAEIYSAADVLLNPTLEDNYPTVNLESIACGTPVVVNNTGGASETIINEFGYIANDYMHSQMIKLIREKIFSDKDFTKKYEEIELAYISKINMISSYINLCNNFL
jgi:glycosyltransferase involved in cell wall biosynthesis